MGESRLRDRPEARRRDRARDRRGADRRARARDRRRRRQHLPRHGRLGGRHGPGDGGLRGHARDGPERARAAGRARARRRRHASALGARGVRGGGALHPPPRDAAPREGPGRHLRGRHRQPVLHDRHRGGAARARDRRRSAPDGQERHEGRLRRRSAHRPDRDLPAGADPPRGDRARAARDGHDRALALHGERAADPRLRARGGQHPPRRHRRAGRNDHLRHAPTRRRADADDRGVPGGRQAPDGQVDRDDAHRVQQRAHRPRLGGAARPDHDRLLRHADAAEEHGDDRRARAAPAHGAAVRPDPDQGDREGGAWSPTSA